MNPSLPANSQSVDPNLPGYTPVPRPSIAMDAPSEVPQTNQGGQLAPGPVGDFKLPPWPQILYITPMQRDIIVMLIKAQGLWPAGAIVKNDAEGLGLPPSLGDAQVYSLYWREGSVWRTDNLGFTYWSYQDQAWAARRAHNPAPRMHRTADGSFEFGDQL